MFVYVFGYFPVAGKKKKSVKKEKKKKRVQKLFWATAQIVSRYNGKLYRDIAAWVCSGSRCIAIGRLVGLGGGCVTIQNLYRD